MNWKNFSKICSVAMSIVMVFSMMPLPAYANEGTGEASGQPNAELVAGGGAVLVGTEPSSGELLDSEMPVFDQSVWVDDAKISVYAPEGVFPAGAKLSAEKVPAAEQQRAGAAIEGLRGDDAMVAASYTFDIKVFGADGVTELEPADKAKVKVSFALAEAADENLTTEVYHVTANEEDGGLSAEKLNILPAEAAGEAAPGESTAGKAAPGEPAEDDAVPEAALPGATATVSVETDSFSYYTVEFTYGKLQYVMQGDTSIPMSEVLAAVGLTGEVSAAEVSDSTLLAVSDEGGKWMVTALKPFLTEEWMKVTVNDVVYEIAVTDDPGVTINNVSYKELSWDGSQVATEDKTHNATAVPSNGAMASGWYYLNSNVTKDGRVSVSGDTHLILGDGYKLDVKGFYVPKGSTLTVYAQSNGTGAGKIYSKPSGGAAIGAYSGHKGGNIVIHGGKIEAYGHDHCAGIGSNDDDRSDVGSITIYGGDITAAAGGDSGAGIGGGRASEGGNITIYGGKVNATGAHYGAGIGGGNGQDTNPIRGAHGGKITIWGGNITAKGGDDGAGIGGGEGGNAGTIVINGGTVNATGGNNSAGIGTGEGESTGVGGTVTINGGNVTAQGGGDAAGIGGGEDANCDAVTINGGTVKATGGSNGAGIGAGRNTNGGHIVITGGDITAEGKDSSAGIGGADPSGSFADFTSIEISGGTVKATGNSKGAGIGGGEYGHATISISGGNITANGGSSGGAGIGNGKDGSGSAILLDYTDETAESISITTVSYKGTVTLLKPFKNSAAEPDTFRETSSVSDLGKLAANPPLVAWTDAEPIATEVEVNSWATLQTEINDTLTNEKKITLTGSISPASGDTRIEIPKGKNITIDLNGFTMDRKLANASVKNDGSAIHVAEGGTLTIADGSNAQTGTITGGHSTRGGGILNEGTLTIKGGTISGNKASASGGSNGTGGGIYNAGTLMVSGGSINGNTAATWGGGIYLADGTGSTLNLNGGQITNNTCSNNGGGVHVSGSAYINASGNPVVTDNKRGAQDNNVNLADGTYIRITGALKEEARIGAHMSFPTSGNITSGLRGRGTETNFDSDDDAYEVRIDGSGEAFLYRAANRSVNNWQALQDAINAANDGDIIQLAGDVIRTGQLTRIQVKGKRVTIDLAGHKLDRALNDKYDDGQVIEVFNGATLTIRDSAGGGLITRGYAKRGGGIYVNEGATCIITGGTITGNTATDDGGGIYVKGTLKMMGGGITHNTAEDNGGGMFVEESGRINLAGADISYNTAEDDGGGIKTYSKGDARITGCTINYNKTNDKYGGGILMDMSDKTMTVTDTKIDHNNADDDGGGIYLRKGTIVMNGGSISENWSRRDSGGVRVEAKTTFTATGVTIHKNISDTEEGGGVKSYGTTTLTSCVVSNNKSQKQGGGLYNDDADGGAGVLNLYGCAVFGNVSQHNGAGIYSDYKLTVIGGSVTGNISNKRGGGIFIGDDSKDTNIGGDLVVKDNGAMDEGKDIFLRTHLLVVQEKLLDGAMIGITKENDGGLGEFTKDYRVKNDSDEPSRYFFSPEGFQVQQNSGTREVELVSGWKWLQGQITNACVEDGEPNTVKLTHDYTAASDDDALEVSKGKKVIIDLNGHTLNRNLSSEGKAGHVIRIRDDAELTLIDSTATADGPGAGTITGGYSEHGGGINIGHDATLIARGINVTGNKADDDGGGVYANDGGTLQMENCVVSGNYADDNGGGIFTGEDADLVELKNVSVLGNTSHNDGGGMKLWLGDDALIEDCVFSGNHADDHGGGMYIEAKDSTLTIRNTKIDNNSAKDDGAGILLQTGTIKMTGGSVSGNTTDNDGGGVKVTNKTEFHAEDVDISNNTAQKEQGGGLKSIGVTTLKGCTISGNTAGDCGGGLFNDKYDSGSKGQMTVEDCRIFNNSTEGTGGGIWNNYELTLKGNNLIGVVPAEEGEEALPGNHSGTKGGGIYFRGDDGFIKLEGKLVATGNEAAIGDDIYLGGGKKLELTGSITDTNVGEIDMSSTGVFTKNYSTYYPYNERDETTNHPSNFFGTNPTALPAEWTNDHTEARLNSDWPDLQALIDAAADRQDMTDKGHPETTDGCVVLDKDYTAGTNNTRLKINAGYNVTVDLNGHVLDRNLTAKTDNGQVFELFSGATLTLNDSTAKEKEFGTGALTGGYSGWGGAIYINSGATLNMESGMIVGNNAENRGGAIYNLGTLNMTGGVLMGNSANEHGAGIFSGENSSFCLENVLISNNTAGTDGGGIHHCKAKDSSIKNSTITNNNAVRYGGGLCKDSPDAKLTIENTTIENNLSGDDGAGIHLTNGSIDMTGGSISGNGTQYDSGGIKVTENTTFTAEGVEIKNNRALKEEGGGIKNYGTTTLTGCTISGNSAGKQGGGIYNDDYDGSIATVKLKNCTVNDNSSNSSGGGIYSDKKLSIDSGTITGNRASDKGGGVFIGGDSDTTSIEWAPVIRDNKASNFGDNMYLRSGRKLEPGILMFDADIHVDLETGTGVLTKGYRAANGTDDPKKHFTFAKGYESRFTAEGEVEIISGWNALKKKVESAKSGAVIILDKDYAASDSDDRIKIDGNKNITIDLNGHTLNRRRKDRVNDGHVLEVFGGSTLTIKDSSEGATGTIMGAWSYEGGIFVNENATLNLQGGTITGNRADSNGGGIFADGTVTMTGGTVEANKTSGSGGGIHMTGGTLNLEGGTVKGNEAGDKGGGIRVNGGTAVTVKGGPVVFGNRGFKGGADIYLPKGKVLTVTGAFTEGARLGVAREENKGRITINYSARNGDADPAQYFVSTEGYGVYLEDGEAVFDKVRTYGETEYTDPFISRKNQITDSDALSSRNWMSGISGERYLNEINTPGSHDSGMNNVDEKYEGKSQLWAQLIGLGVGVGGLLLCAGLAALSPFTAGFTGVLAGWIAPFATTALVATIWTNLAVPTDWTSLVGALADGRAADMAKTQRLYIDEQLDAGARQLDIRLGCRYKDYKWYVNGYLWEDDGTNLWLCHGKKAGGTYLAENHEGNYLSFNEVLTWVKDFLEEHPTETIILDLRPETMDSSNFQTIYDRTRTILETSALQINPSTGEPFLYKEPGSDDYFAPYTHMPKLSDARGKIVLMPEKDEYVNRVGGFRLHGLSEDVVDELDYQNTASEMVEQVRTVYFDVNGDGHMTLPTEAGTGFPDTLWYWELNCTGEHSGISNYVSGDTPHVNADYVNPNVVGAGKTLGPDQTGQYIGWVRMDSFEGYYAEQIWRTNFFDGLQYRTVTVKSGGLDEKNYPDQTYQQLKGAEFQIPGNIYKQLPEGRYFECWEADDGTRYYPGDTFRVDEDVTFTAVWLKAGEIPVRAVWMDGNDADDLRPESVDVKVKAGSATKDATLTREQDWRTVLNLTGDITDIVPSWDLVDTSVDPHGQDKEGQYRYELSHEEGAGHTITFIHTPHKTTSTFGMVKWKADPAEDEGEVMRTRPESVTIHLWKGNEEIATQVVSVGEDGSWAFNFGEKPLYENGEKIEYRVTETMDEEAASRYSISVDGFTVTNTYVPQEYDKAMVLGIVEWDDGNNKDGNRPGRVGVTLKANGAEAGMQYVTPGDARMWLWSFDNVPLKNAEGQAIAYTIAPEEIDGYDASWEPVAVEEGANPSEFGDVSEEQRAFLFKVKYTLKVQDMDKAPATLAEAPTAKNPLYNGQPQALINEGSATDGTLMYALGDSADTAPEASAFSAKLPEATNAGTYHVWYYVKGDAYHKDTDFVRIETTIQKAEPVIEADDLNVTAGDTGRAIDAHVTGVVDAEGNLGALSFAVTEGDDVVDVDPTTGALTIKKAGTAKVAVTVAGTANYKPATKEVTITVAPAQHKLTFYEDTEGSVVRKSFDIQDGMTLAGFADYGTAEREEMHKDGYTFAGWVTEPGIVVNAYLNTSGELYPALRGKIFDFNQVVEGDVNAYPLWIGDRLEVNIDTGAPEGEVTIDEAQSLNFIVNIDEKIAMRYLKDAKRDGYELAGWYTQGGVLWNGENWKTLDYVTSGWKETAGWGMTPEYCNRYENGDVILEVNMPRRYNYYTVTLQARWTPKQVPVEYVVGQDGTGEVADGSTYGLGDVITLGDAPAAKEGKTFTGWKLEGDDALYSAGGQFTFKDWNLVKDGKLTFTAQYIDTQRFAVTFDSKGGTAVEPAVVLKGRKVAEEPATTRDGYTFLGWFDEDKSTTERVAFPYEPAEDATLTAHWQANKYTITFDSAGGSAVDSITADYGTEVTPPENPTKAHYKFGGWSPALPATMPLGGLKVTATWEPTEYSVTFDKGDGSEPKVVKGIFGSVVEAPEAPTKDGSVFAGWRDADDNPVAFPLYMPDTNPKYNAKWIALPAPPAAASGLVYNGAPQALVSGGSAEGVRTEYALGSDATTVPEDGWGTNVPAATDAGGYHVWWRVIGDDGHAIVAPACIDVAIAKAEQTIFSEGTVAGTVGETGKTVAAFVTGVNGTAQGVGALSYEMVEGAEVASVDPETGALTFKAPGTAKVKVKAAETGNYNEASTEVEITVALAKRTLTFFEDIEGERVWKALELEDGASLEEYAGYGTQESETLEKPGYTFAGWATEPGVVVDYFRNGSGVLNPKLEDKLANFNTTIDRDRDLYPIWIRDCLNVKLVPGGDETTPVTWGTGFDGKEQSDDFYVDIDEKLYMDGLNGTKRKGYDLEGWSTQGGVKWPADSSWGVTSEYCDKNAEGNPILTVDEQGKYKYYTVTLTARWTPKQVPVEYVVGQDGTGEVTDTNTYGLGDVVTLQGAPTANEGKAFTGWKLEGDDALYSAGGQFTFKDWSLVKDGKLTFTARYIDKAAVAVTFQSNGGTAVEPIAVYPGMTIEDEPATTRDGYTFLGWFDESTSTAERVAFPFAPTGDTTLTAHWQANEYKIAFDSAGGSAVEPITAGYGAEVAPPADPKKPHYEFAGWSPALPATMPLGGLTVTATWKPAVYSVTFDAGDGNEPAKVEGIYGSVVEEPAAPEKDGFVFAGWRDASGNPVAFPLYMPDDEPTYTAKWIALPAPPAAIEGLAYTGGPQALVSGGSAEGATIEYALGPDGEAAPKGGWGAEAPEATDADGYHVWWRVVGDDGSVIVAPACVEATIAKANQEISVGEALAGSVGEAGRAIEASVTGVGGTAQGVGALSYEAIGGKDVVSVDPKTGALTFKAPGTAKVKVKAAETKNYNEASTEVEISVASVKRMLTFFEDTEGKKVWKALQLEDGASLEGYAAYGLEESEKLEKPGYTFAGWATESGVVVDSYADESGKLNPALEGKLFDFDRVIMADLNAYPLWIRDCLNVKLVAADGEATSITWGTGYDGKEQSDDFYVDIDEKLRMEGLNGTTREGYELNGWYTQSGVKWPTDNSWGVTPEYCDKQAGGDPIVTTDEQGKYKYYTVTLTAHWTPVKVGVKYVVGEGGTGEVTDTNTYGLGDVFALQGAPTANVGKTFTGWKLEGDDALYSAGGQFTFKDWGLVKDSKLTFTAQYVDKAAVAVTFESNGGTAVEPVAVYPGTTIKDEPATTRDGYTFLGWFDESKNKTERVTFPFAPAGDTKLTAHWQANKYTITFDSAGGNAVDSITAQYGATISDRVPTDPKKSHYDFDGWYPALPATMPLGGLKVTATWKPTEYSVTFDKGDGSEPETVTDIYGSVVEAPEPPTKDGSVFAGWRDESGNPVAFPLYMPDTNPTFTAKWKAAAPAAPAAEAVDATTASVKNPDDGQEYALVPKGDPAPAADSDEWKSPGEDGAVTWTGLDPKTEYDVYARVKATDDKDASEPSEPATVKTPGLTPEVVPPKANDLTHTGKAQALVEAGKAKGGTLVYALGEDAETPPGDGAYGEAIPEGIDAGTYYVWYKVVGDASHDDAEATCLAVTIREHEHKAGSAQRENQVAATCTGEGGYDEVVYCTGCGKMLSSVHVTVPALGHDWGEWKVTKEATETAEGAEARTCSRCDEVETRSIPKTSVVSYRAVSGDGATWTKGSGDSLVFTFKRNVDDNETFSHFTDIRVDGADVDKSNYASESGSVVIKLKPAFLETLSIGNHSITALFDDGGGASASAGFKVIEKGSGNDPGDGDDGDKDDGDKGDGDKDDGNDGGNGGGKDGGESADGNAGGNNGSGNNAGGSGNSSYATPRKSGVAATGVPATGDNLQMALMASAALLFVSVLALVSLASIRRKRSRQ